MMRPSVAGALVALAFAGCGSDTSENSLPEARTIELSEIEVLADDARFVSVRDMALASEAVWILDAAPPFLSRVSLRGSASVQVGNEGQGPGELLAPRVVQPFDAPHTTGARVWDLGSGTVTTFDSGGGLLGSERLSDQGRIRVRSDIRDVTYSDPFRIRSIGQVALATRFPGRFNRTADMGTGSLWRGDVRLEPQLELARFRDHMELDASSLREWAAVPLWDACDGAVVLWSPKSAELIWLDLNGRRETSTGVEMHPTPVSEEDIKAYLQWMGRLELGPGYLEAGINFTSMARANRDRFADLRPFATDVRCEASGVAWIRLFDTSSDPLGRGQAWIRVPEDGAPKEYRFPIEFSPFVFTDQVAFGALESTEGHQRLGRWTKGRFN